VVSKFLKLDIGYLTNLNGEFLPVLLFIHLVFSQPSIYVKLFKELLESFVKKFDSRNLKILLNLVKKLNVDNRVFNRSIVLLIFLLKKKKKNPKAFLKFCHLSDKLLLKIISRLQVEYN
jgi:hypothetical protein